MTMPARGMVSNIQEMKIKLAVQFRCEWCEETKSPAILDLHLLVDDTGSYLPTPDPQKKILVLCPDCHRDIHEIPLPLQMQKDLVRKRSFARKKRIRAILDYTPPPYAPPDNQNYAEIYEECFSLRSLDMFRAGG
ncbi:MAG TPA: hypothetical protein VMW63_09085 [Methanoregulaceae archaeon]|nr:hypothetical protein [Methanoregulaceae archaeon]